MSGKVMNAGADDKILYKVGDILQTKNGFIGVCRFIGHVEFSSTSIWVGLELGAADGKNDGSVLGKRYFSCRSNFGLFAKQSLCYPAAGSTSKNGIEQLNNKVKVSNSDVKSTSSVSVSSAQKRSNVTESAATVINSSRSPRPVTSTQKSLKPTHSNPVASTSFDNPSSNEAGTAIISESIAGNETLSPMIADILTKIIRSQKFQAELNNAAETSVQNHHMKLSQAATDDEGGMAVMTQRVADLAKRVSEQEQLIDKFACSLDNNMNEVMKGIESIQIKVDNFSSSSSSSSSQSLDRETDEMKSLKQALVAVAELAKTAKLVAAQERLKYEERIYKLEKRLLIYEANEEAGGGGNDDYYDSMRHIKQQTRDDPNY